MPSMAYGRDSSNRRVGVCRADHVFSLSGGVGSAFFAGAGSASWRDGKGTSAWFRFRRQATAFPAGPPAIFACALINFGLAPLLIVAGASWPAAPETNVVTLAAGT